MLDEFEERRVAMSKIHFNGKTYNDIAEMPAMERQAYEQLMSIFKDEDQDGVPDILQGDVIGNIVKAVTTTVVVDGQPVSGLGEMTPEQRAKLEKGLIKLKELGFISQVPDLSGTQAPTWQDAEIRPSKPVISSSPAIQEDRGPRVGAILAIVLLLALCVFGVVAFYLLEYQ
jgi:hypothetical protein